MAAQIPVVQAADKAADKGEASPGKGRGKLLLIIIVSTAVVLLGAGVGAALWLTAGAKKPAGHAAAEAPKAAPAPTGPPLFLALDTTFVVSNAHKIPQGGGFSLLIGAVALTLMLSWRRGREVALAEMPVDGKRAALALQRQHGLDDRRGGAQRILLRHGGLIGEKRSMARGHGPGWRLRGVQV